MKLKVILLCFLIPFCLKAQKDSTFSKKLNYPEFTWSIYGGSMGILPMSNITPISQDTHSDPYTMLFLAPALDISGKRAHLNIEYDFASSSFCFVTGYVFKRDIDLYGIIQKRTQIADKSFGVGVGKILPVVKRINSFYFLEVDSDLEFPNEKYFISVGLLFQFEMSKIKQE